jgi:hypothetical protein
MVSIKRIFADFRVFSVGYLRNKFGLFFGLIFPVILILIFGAIFSGGGTGTVYVYAQNRDTGAYGQNIGDNFLSALNESSTMQVVTVDASENFPDFLAAHSASDGIVIPSNFTEDYITGQQVNVTVYGNPASSTSGIVSGTVSGFIGHFNLARFNGTAVIGYNSATVNTQQTAYIDFLIPGLIGFSILTSPMFSLVNISSEYKKNKIFKQLSLTPLTKMEWSKVMFYIALTLAGFILMRRRSTSLRRPRNTITLVNTLLNLGPNAVCVPWHASWHSNQEPRNRRRNRQHSNLPNDVPCRHFLPNQQHARIPTSICSYSATFLRYRRLKQRHGLQQHTKRSH